MSGAADPSGSELQGSRPVRSGEPDSEGRFGAFLKHIQGGLGKTGEMERTGGGITLQLISLECLVGDGDRK